MIENGEYGRFFPKSLSPLYYNKSESNLYFPLAREEAIKRGFKWDDQKEPEDSKPAIQVPDNIRDVKDDILQAEIKCLITGKKYKIIKQELDYYRKNNIPIPTISPLQRISDRSSILKINELHVTKCAKCGKEIKTVYNSDNLLIYCDECYLKEVY